ncbi:hypothetical protein [Hymenobacter jeollabukensis]|nr:hypothetical protein [Hymenobacter jeollabukensis]
MDETHFEYLSPSRYEHINQLGKYSFESPAQVGPQHRDWRA